MIKSWEYLRHNVRWASEPMQVRYDPEEFFSRRFDSQYKQNLLIKIKKRKILMYYVWFTTLYMRDLRVITLSES